MVSLGRQEVEEVLGDLGPHGPGCCQVSAGAVNPEMPPEELFSFFLFFFAEAPEELFFKQKSIFLSFKDQ